MTVARPKPYIPTRTERQVSEQVVQAAAMLGIELKRRNVGMALNPRGRAVRFGDPGDGDFYCVLPDGRHADIEIKREGFDPSRLRGAKRAHFERQLAEMRRINASNGVAFWVSDATDFLHAMRKVLAGWRVEIDDEGFPWVTDEPTGGDAG